MGRAEEERGSEEHEEEEIETNVISINPDLLPSTWMSDLRDLPDSPGIYFVMRGLLMIYIGQSNNIRLHWKNHRLKKMIPQEERNLIRIAWMEADLSELDSIETALIKLYQPELNLNDHGVGGLTREAKAAELREEGLLLIREIRKNGRHYRIGQAIPARKITDYIWMFEWSAKEYWGTEETIYYIRPYDPDKKVSREDQISDAEID